MALDICRGMAFLHSVNIVHRDLKPHRLVSHDGNVKICDFGVSRVDARRLTRRRHKNAMITTGHAGSPLFMPPEALRGDAERCHKSRHLCFGYCAGFSHLEITVRGCDSRHDTHEIHGSSVYSRSSSELQTIEK